MFQPVNSRVDFAALEDGVLSFWRENAVFEESLRSSVHKPLFVFYEGPPTANGTPGIHHVLARIFKDCINRHRTMSGFYVPRKGGWDTHGLPVELEVERELGLASKAEIETYGVEQFNQRCRESVFRYVREWEAMTERIGFWLDTRDAYVTYKNEYIESCWWILRQLWDKNLLYRGHKVTPYCSRCGTSLSSHEVAQGYRETDDPSVYVKFEISEGSVLDLVPAGHQVYLLAWTTTPWTLPGNVALAVSPQAEYALAELTSDGGVGEFLIVAESLLEAALRREHRVVAVLPGSDLVGTRYLPLYSSQPLDRPAHRVVGGAFVTLEDGSGIVHIAPAFGEIDLEVSKSEDLPILQTVDLRGRVVGVDPRFNGAFVKDADPLILDDLRQRGLLHRLDKVHHTYPYCWRCDSPLLYYAKSSWYIRTTACKERLISANDEINWVPEHIKHGRFGDWLENNVDWALSRERYWGTPLNIWQCSECDNLHCVGSVRELGELSRDASLVGLLDLHRPYVDRVEFACAKCGGVMRRVPEVIDAWFDSGAMPICQWHYPFENNEIFDKRFPADFISEAVDQTRGWFYSLHALGVLLFDRPAFRNVIVLGHMQDAKGEKMSKSRGNVVDPWDVFNLYGADALRWYMYTASPAGQPRRFSTELVAEVVRKFMLTLWNTYSFFVTYAIIDRFAPRGLQSISQWDDLDRWILSELNSLVDVVDKGLESYDLTGSARAIQAFVDDLSNWYVRRSRRRFWKSESDADKAAAYETLHHCLVTISKLLAPFAPFLAESMYQNLVRNLDVAAPLSVHLTDFPKTDAARVDRELEESTRLVMRVTGLGRAARSKANLKVRQPLSEVLVHTRTGRERDTLRRLGPQILDELNVKRFRFAESESELLVYTIKARTNILGPKYGREIPAVLKALAALDPTVVARAVRAGSTVDADGFTLQPEDIEVSSAGRAGFAVAAEGDCVVAVRTELTPELLEEGLAREMVHRIQTMRKSAGFQIEDRIVTYFAGDEPAQRVFQRHAAYIRQETLSVDLVSGEAPSDAYTETVRADDISVRLAVLRSS